MSIVIQYQFIIQCRLVKQRSETLQEVENP
jgi:hypothetical protein